MWRQVIDWLLNVFSQMGRFTEFLFTEYTLADALTSNLKVITNNFMEPSNVQTILQTFRMFIDQNFDWMNGVSFTPISVVSISGLVVVVVIGVIKLFDLWA